MNTQNRADVTPVQIHADHAAEKGLGNWTAAEGATLTLDDPSAAAWAEKNQMARFRREDTPRTRRRIR